MSSKKFKIPEHVNHERWLVSYADFITLLFAFFVVLFSSSSVERSTTKKMALAINVAFDEISIFREKSGDSFEPSEKGGGGGSAQSFKEMLLVNQHSRKKIVAPSIESSPSEDMPLGPYSANTGSGFLSSPEKGMVRLHRDLMDIVNKKKVSNFVKVNENNDNLTLTIEQKNLYIPGTSKYTKDAEKVFSEVGKLLKDIPNQVRVEGHTDKSEDKTEATSLAESTIGASRAIQKLVTENKLDPSRFIAAGYGDLYPIASNDTVEGRTQNRRVNIVILSTKAGLREAPLFHLPSKSTSPSSENNDSIDLPFIREGEKTSSYH